MRVGVLLRDIRDPSPKSGGSNTFKSNIIHGLSNVKTDHEIIVFHEGHPINSGVDTVKYVSMDPYWYKYLPKLPRRIIRKGRQVLQSALGRSIMASPLERAARDHKVSLLWFPKPEHVDTGLPYITTVWDLGHRTAPIFPELRRSGWTWEERESHYDTVLGKATRVVTGTETSKEQIQKYYQTNEGRIKVNPFPTPLFSLDNSENSCGREVNQQRLGDFKPFIFYPANFWPHKNHIAILEALHIIRKEGINISAVFTGSNKGNKKYIKDKSVEIGVSEAVHFLGFVSVKELKSLYRNAVAMVFVSLMGPDNLPPLEAFALGCPVIAQDTPGAEEQLGEAALHVDPTSGLEIAKAIQQLYESPEKRDVFRERGHERARHWRPVDYVSRMMDIISECESHRRCWDPSDDYEKP